MQKLLSSLTARTNASWLAANKDGCARLPAVCFAEGEQPLVLGNRMLAPSTIFARCLCSSPGGDAQELDLMAEKQDDGTNTAGQD